MPFRIALSGLNAASTDLKVTGNNVANAGTYGFKSSRTEFADVFASTFGGASGVGGGVRVASVMQEFEQGTIDFTGNSLDMAINGGGFFVMSDGGTRVYSRAGAFLVDKDGFVVNSQNQRLQVFPPLDEAGTTFNTASPTDVQLSLDQGAPQATTGINASLNLRADAEDLGAGAIDPADPDTFSYSTSATIYDSLGASHTATLYFRKTGTNTWDVRTDIDGAAATVGGQNQTTLTFNADGSLASGGTVAYDAFTPANGAAPLALTAELAGTTQFGGSFSVASLTQDGFASGRLSGVQIDEAGVIFARYTNGQSRAMGKVALANFPNPNGLQQLGDNAWAATFQAGTAQTGEAGTGSFGAIQSGGLESSNVDIAEQLVNLITAQRNFQANAQVITTADSVTQTIINLR